MPACQGCTESICSHCGKDKNNATLKCPTCSQLGLVEGVFCCQECFKSSWPKHKLRHTSQKSTPVPIVETDNDPLLARFRNYQFSGKLRPSTQSPQATVADDVPKPDYAETGHPESEMAIKRSL